MGGVGACNSHQPCCRASSVVPHCALFSAASRGEAAEVVGARAERDDGLLRDAAVWAQLMGGEQACSSLRLSTRLPASQRAVAALCQQTTAARCRADAQHTSRGRVRAAGSQTQPGSYAATPHRSEWAARRTPVSQSFTQPSASLCVVQGVRRGSQRALSTQQLFGASLLRRPLVCAHPAARRPSGRKASACTSLVWPRRTVIGSGARFRTATAMAPHAAQLHAQHSCHATWAA